MAAKKICVFGNFGTGNIGNEGTLEAWMGFLSGVAPLSQIQVICSEPDVVSGRYGVTAYPHRAPRGEKRSPLSKLTARFADIGHLYQALRGVDLLFIPGTGLFDDTGEPFHGMPLTLFALTAAARLRGAKIYIVSMGAGPIRHWLSRSFMTRAARFAAYRSYRDELSRAFMASVGVRGETDKVYPDLAFGLPTPPAAGRAEAEPLRIGVGMMTYDGWRGDDAERQGVYEAYVAKMTAFVLWLHEQGREIRLLIGEDTDATAVEDVLSRLRERNPALAEAVQFEPARSLHELMQQIAETDVVVATRFHNIICALKMGRPAVSAGYADRFHALMEDVGLGAFSQDVDSLDVERLKEHVTQVCSDHAALERLVQSKVEGYREKLREQNAFLSAEISTVVEAASEGDAV